MVDSPQLKMTAKEFAELSESNQFVELLDGELIMSPTPVDHHQDAVFSIATVVKQLIPEGGKVKIAPLEVHFDEINIAEPDVFCVLIGSLAKLGEDGYWYGAPDLVVEVLSPSTAKFDKGKKYNLYEHYGVREYWIADPVAKFVEVFVLTEGKFARYGVFGLGETFVSPVLAGKVVVVDRLFDYA
jgi:Uma2 family endonuclease